MESRDRNLTLELIRHDWSPLTTEKHFRQNRSPAIT